MLETGSCRELGLGGSYLGVGPTFKRHVNSKPFKFFRFFTYLFKIPGRLKFNIGLALDFTVFFCQDHNALRLKSFGTH